jgi:hypothetical protein
LAILLSVWIKSQLNVKATGNGCCRFVRSGLILRGQLKMQPIEWGFLSKLVMPGLVPPLSGSIWVDEVHGLE